MNYHLSEDKNEPLNIEHMKTLKIVLSIAIVASITSCNMNNEPPQPNLSHQIMGTYEGTLMSSLSQDAIPATAEITSVNNYTIQVHCHSADIDTTFSLGLYPDGNMMKVCSTGNDFKNQYGHHMSINSQMMGNMSNGTPWQRHMDAEHKSGDDHYGYFDINARMFNYTFNFLNNPTGYTQHFIGKR